MTDVVIGAAEWLTHLGDYHSLIAVTAAYGLLIADRFDPRPLALVLVAIVLVGALKAHYAIPRPPGAGVGGNAFPSGHATVSMVAYLSIAIVEDRRVAVALALAGTIAATRVVIGVHYPIDVVAGLVLGAVIATWGTFALYELPRRGLEATDAIPAPLVGGGPVDE